MRTSTPTSSCSRGNEVLGFAHGIWRAARLPMTFGLVIGVICGIPPIALATEEVEASAAQPMPDERFAIHGQTTYVEQETDLFTAAYSGPNSLSPDSGRETIDATLFVGARLWSGAEGWITPEIDQGFGLDNTLGVAGFPSGEAYKVGKKEPYLRLPRAFVRQTINLSEATEAVEAGANQLGGSRSSDRWVFTLGKFAVTDIFDTNQYAHDPRSDFLNWSAVDSGSFDYAADAWGFTVGAPQSQLSMGQESRLQHRPWPRINCRRTSACAVVISDYFGLLGCAAGGLRLSLDN